METGIIVFVWFITLLVVGFASALVWLVHQTDLPLPIKIVVQIVCLILIGFAIYFYPDLGAIQ